MAYGGVSDGELESMGDFDSPLRKLQILNKLIHYIRIFMYCTLHKLTTNRGWSDPRTGRRLVAVMWCYLMNSFEALLLTLSSANERTHNDDAGFDFIKQK